MTSPQAAAGRAAVPGAATHEGMEPAVAVQELTKRFGPVVAVDRLTWSVWRHETVMLWGANGAGKTTVLRCLLGLMPFDGSVEILGMDVRAQGKAARAAMGYVPQEVRFHGEDTVEETVRFYASLRRVPFGRVRELLVRWHLAGAARQAVRGLSGGMKQKLALIVALLADPPVLLLDEPTSNLDAEARREFIGLLEELKAAGKTLICCSHRLAEVWRLADRVIVLQQGRLAAAGPPHSVAWALQQRTVVCLTLEAARISEAMALLERHGLAVERAGTQLLVTVPSERKVQPIQVLLEAGIPVVNLDIDDGR